MRGSRNFGQINTSNTIIIANRAKSPEETSEIRSSEDLTQKRPRNRKRFLRNRVEEC